jgi:transcriptional regulator with XRE-family HTH domain
MERNSKNTLGKVLKSARLDMNLTREKFAEMVGLTPRYIMSIENEGKRPSYDTLYKLIRALGVRADDIFYPEHAGEDTTAGRVSRLLPQCGEHEIKAVAALVETLLSEKP